MYVRCFRCPLRVQPAFAPKSEREVAELDEMKSDHLRIPAGAEFIRPEQSDAELYTVFSGWAYRYKELEDGRLQILNFALPGDLIGLQATLLGKSNYGAVALTDVELCVIPRRKLLSFFGKSPEIAYDVTWLGAKEHALVDENLLTAGRRNAAERIAALVLTLFKRAETLGMTSGQSMAFPLTQQHIADALGLSLVHTNKTIVRLKSERLFSISDGVLTLLNAKTVGRLAQHFEKDPAPRPII